MKKLFSIFVVVGLASTLGAAEKSVKKSKSQAPKVSAPVEVTVDQARTGATSLIKYYFSVYSWEYSQARMKEAPILPSSILQSLLDELNKIPDAEMVERARKFNTTDGREKAIVEIMTAIDERARNWEKETIGYTQNRAVPVVELVQHHVKNPYTPEIKKKIAEFIEKPTLVVPKVAQNSGPPPAALTASQSPFLYYLGTLILLGLIAAGGIFIFAKSKKT